MLIDITKELRATEIPLVSLARLIMVQTGNRNTRPMHLSTIKIMVDGKKFTVFYDNAIELGSYKGDGSEPEWSVKTIVAFLNENFWANVDLIDPRLLGSFDSLAYAVRSVLPKAKHSAKYYNKLVHPSYGAFQSIVLSLGAGNHPKYTGIAPTAFEKQVHGLFDTTIAEQLCIYVKQIQTVIRAVMKPDTNSKIETALINQGDGQGFDYHLRITFTDLRDNIREHGVNLDSTVIDFATGNVYPTAENILMSIEV